MGVQGSMGRARGGGWEGRWWPGSSATVGTRVSSHAGVGNLRQGPPWVSKRLRSPGLPS